MPGGPTCCGEEAPQPRDIKDYANMITKDECHCGAELPVHHSAIHLDPQDDGWAVEGYEDPQWLYIVCPQCGEQWALWKLGVPR